MFLNRDAQHESQSAPKTCQKVPVRPVNQEESSGNPILLLWFAHSGLWAWLGECPAFLFKKTLFRDAKFRPRNQLSPVCELVSWPELFFFLSLEATGIVSTIISSERPRSSCEDCTFLRKVIRPPHAETEDEQCLGNDIQLPGIKQVARIPWH